MTSETLMTGLKFFSAIAILGILGLLWIGRIEKGGKKVVSVTTSPSGSTPTQTPKGFFASLEKNHNYGLIIAFGFFPMLLAIAMDWDPFGLWTSPYRWAYLVIGFSGFIIGGILRFKGDTGRQILMWMYVGLIVIAVIRMVAGLGEKNETLSRRLQEQINVSFPTSRVKKPDEVPPLDRNEAKVPRVWQDVGRPPNFGHRYELVKGWNRTFVFKASGEDDFYILPKQADVVVSFEGSNPDTHEPTVFTMLLNAGGDASGVWIPTEFNGRLYLYAPASGKEVLVFKKKGDFVFQVDRHFLDHRSTDHSDALSNVEHKDWQVILRNPKVPFELPEFEFDSGQELTLLASGPFWWRNGSEETLLLPDGDKPIRIRLRRAGYLRFRAEGPHDVFLRVLSS